MFSSGTSVISSEISARLGLAHVCIDQVINETVKGTNSAGIVSHCVDKALRNGSVMSDELVVMALRQYVMSASLRSKG